MEVNYLGTRDNHEGSVQIVTRVFRDTTNSSPLIMYSVFPKPCSTLRDESPT